MGCHLRSLHTALVLGTGFLVWQPATAHHAITGEFNTQQAFALRGVLTRLDWINPHMWYYLDVTDHSGAVTAWQCTTGISPTRLNAAGWSKEDLPPGTVINAAVAHPAWDKPNTCYIRGITLDDGTPVFSGSRKN